MHFWCQMLYHNDGFKKMQFLLLLKLVFNDEYFWVTDKAKLLNFIQLLVLILLIYCTRIFKLSCNPTVLFYETEFRSYRYMNL